MISGWEVYLLLKLDAIGGMFFGVSTISFVFALVCTIIMAMWNIDDDDKKQTHHYNYRNDLAHPAAFLHTAKIDCRQQHDQRHCRQLDAQVGKWRE